MSDTDPENTPPQPAFQPLDEAARKAQKRRNAWLALALISFVAIIGIATMVRIGEEAAKPDSGLYYSID